MTAPMKATREREAKLGAWAGFALPDLTGVLDGVTVRPAARAPRSTPSTTTPPDLRLARWGASLRYRTGDGTGWTVKLADGDDGPALVRRELTFQGKAVGHRAGRGGQPGPGLRPQRAARARGPPPHPPPGRRAARRRGPAPGRGRRRRGVGATRAGRLASRFREVEVELGGGRQHGAARRRRRRRCTQAGAGAPEPTPKVVRALGARAREPPELVAGEAAATTPPPATWCGPPSPRRSSASSATTPACASATTPRTSTRPGSAPAACAPTCGPSSPLLDPEWLAALRRRAEVAGRGAGRGPRRRRPARAAPAPGRVPARGRRPGRGHPRPPAGAAAGGGPGRPARGHGRPPLRRAARPAGRRRPRTRCCSRRPTARPPRSCPPSSCGPWKKLAKAVKALDDPPPDEELHAVRIRAKRCRYAVEAVAPVVGKEAKRIASAVAGLQGVLGDHQDAVVAEGWLREAARGAGRVQAGGGRAHRPPAGRGRGVPAGVVGGLARGQGPEAAEVAPVGQGRLGRPAGGRLRPPRRRPAAADEAVVRAGGGVVWRRRRRRPDRGAPRPPAQVRRLEPAQGQAPRRRGRGRPPPCGRWRRRPACAACWARSCPPARYHDRFGRPKTVRYWAMTPVPTQSQRRSSPTSEVDEVRWLTPTTAAELLSYDRDREVLRSLRVETARDPRAGADHPGPGPATPAGR